MANIPALEAQTKLLGLTLLPMNLGVWSKLLDISNLVFLYCV